MSRIALIGAGAIGGAIASRLSAHELTLCTRTPLAALVVETPEHVRRPSFTSTSNPLDAPAVDWVLLCTKAHQTAGARRWLEALCRPPAVLAVLQNGVDHEERVRPFVPDTPVVPVVVSCSATRLQAGHIVQRGLVQLTVPAGPQGSAFAALFAGSGAEVALTADFTTAVWRKLCVNVPTALLALTAQPAGILRREDLAQLARGLILETVQVGRAEGAQLDDGLADTLVAALQAGPADATSSILSDVLARRPLEVDARNGAVVRYGARHGIATPLNAAITALLGGLSAGFTI